MISSELPGSVEIVNHVDHVHGELLVRYCSSACVEPADADFQGGSNRAISNTQDRGT